MEPDHRPEIPEGCYEVDITLRATTGPFETPDEAIAAATAKLGITDPVSVVRVEVRKGS